MKTNFPSTLPLVLLTALLTGCSSLSTRQVIDLAPFRHIYVVHRLTDDHHLDEMMVRELQKLGRDASHGPLTMLPNNADAILTYQDRWEWDFQSYLIEFTIELHTARTEKKLADGRYYQPSPKPRPPAEIIREILTPLFQPKLPGQG
ncbi:MAG: hypothetical protein EXS32_07050 [Opitutus sp.]|nr:hypothetical protein [Opitutus sp.]